MPGEKFSTTHVGFADQVEDDVARLRMGEIDRNAALAHVQAHEIAALVGATRLELLHGIAHFVAFARPLDLDHLGAHVREQARTVRARQNAGEVEHGEAGEERFFLVQGGGGGHWRGFRG